MADARPLVPVFGVSGIEAELQAERLILRLLFQEFGCPVAKNLRFVPLASVGLFFEIGPPADLSADVKHRRC